MICQYSMMYSGRQKGILNCELDYKMHGIIRGGRFSHLANIIWTGNPCKLFFKTQLFPGLIPLH